MQRVRIDVLFMLYIAARQIYYKQYDVSSKLKNNARRESSAAELNE